jgi:hypothetical protein
MSEDVGGAGGAGAGGGVGTGVGAGVGDASVRAWPPSGSLGRQPVTIENAKIAGKAAKIRIWDRRRCMGDLRYLPSYG